VRADGGDVIRVKRGVTLKGEAEQPTGRIPLDDHQAGNVSVVAELPPVHQRARFVAREVVQPGDLQAVDDHRVSQQVELADLELRDMTVGAGDFPVGDPGFLARLGPPVVQAVVAEAHDLVPGAGERLVDQRGSLREALQGADEQVDVLGGAAGDLVGEQPVAAAEPVPDACRQPPGERAERDPRHVGVGGEDAEHQAAVSALGTASSGNAASHARRVAVRIPRVGHKAASSPASRCAVMSPGARAASRTASYAIAAWS